MTPRRAVDGPGDVAFTLMLVDDHEVVRSGYRRFIEGEAELAVVDEAGSASEAYSLLQAAEQAGRLPDLVVVDLSLGERSGLDLIDRCARRFPGLRTLVFSMHEDPLLLDHAMAAGACGWVSKSSPPEAMLEAISAIRRGGRWVDPALRARAARSRPHQALFEQLTRRELEILAQLTRGEEPAVVADRLSLSAKTVANHLSSIRAKLRVANDFQLMRLVAEHGLPEL